MNTIDSTISRIQHQQQSRAPYKNPELDSFLNSSSGIRSVRHHNFLINHTFQVSQCLSESKGFSSTEKTLKGISMNTSLEVINEDNFRQYYKPPVSMLGRPLVKLRDRKTDICLSPKLPDCFHVVSKNTQVSFQI